MLGVHSLAMQPALLAERFQLHRKSSEVSVCWPAGYRARGHLYPTPHSPKDVRNPTYGHSCSIWGPQFPFWPCWGAPWSLNGCQADISTASARTPVSWSLGCHCSVSQQQARPQRPGSREGLTQNLRNCQPWGSWVPRPCELPGVDDAPQSSKSVSVHPSCPCESISQGHVKIQTLIQWVQGEAGNAALLLGSQVMSLLLVHWTRSGVEVRLHPVDTCM